MPSSLYLKQTGGHNSKQNTAPSTLLCDPPYTLFHRSYTIRSMVRGADDRCKHACARAYFLPKPLGASLPIGTRSVSVPSLRCVVIGSVPSGSLT